MKLTKLYWLVVPTALMAGCASAPEKNDAVEQANSALQELLQDPQVQARAPSLLLDAEQALNRAGGAESRARQEHDLYLANQLMEVARTVTARKVLEQNLAALNEERDRLQLAAREEDLQRSRQRVSELEAELSALETRQTSRGLMVTLDDVFFETAGATIAPGAEQTLDKLARFMREHQEQEVLIEGHTDSRGTDEYNQQLSERRAESVKRALLARGIDDERIRARGYGESRPIASNATSGGRQLNRRVEILFPEIGGT